MADAYRRLAEDEDLASLEPSRKHEERNILKASHLECLLVAKCKKMGCALNEQMLVYTLVQLVEEAVNAYLQPPSATQAPPTKVGQFNCEWCVCARCIAIKALSKSL